MQHRGAVATKKKRIQRRRFERYELGELLGKSDSGEVWQAHDSEAGEQVYLKLLPKGSARQWEFKESQDVEPRYCELGLEYPCRLAVEGGRIAIVVPHVQGKVLSQTLSVGAPGLDRILRIAESVTAAIRYETIFVNRPINLEPSNVVELDNPDELRAATVLCFEPGRCAPNLDPLFHGEYFVSGLHSVRILIGKMLGLDNPNESSSWNAAVLGLSELPQDALEEFRDVVQRMLELEPTAVARESYDPQMALRYCLVRLRNPNPADLKYLVIDEQNQKILRDTKQDTKRFIRDRATELLQGKYRFADQDEIDEYFDRKIICKLGRYFPLTDEEGDRLDDQISEEIPRVLRKLELSLTSLKRLLSKIESRVGGRQGVVDDESRRFYLNSKHIENDVVGLYNSIADELFRAGKLTEQVLRDQLFEIVSDIVFLAHLGPTDKGDYHWWFGRTQSSLRYPEYSLRFGQFWIRPEYPKKLKRRFQKARADWLQRIETYRVASTKNDVAYRDFIAERLYVLRLKRGHSLDVLVE